MMFMIGLNSTVILGWVVSFFSFNFILVLIHLFPFCLLPISILLFSCNPVYAPLDVLNF